MGTARFFASLCGNVQFEYARHEAADLCISMLAAGSPRAWARALLAMPRSTWEPRIAQFLPNAEQKAAQSLLGQMCEQALTPPDELVAWLETRVRVDEWDWDAATLLSLSSSSGDHPLGIRSCATFLERLREENSKEEPISIFASDYASALSVLAASPDVGLRAEAEKAMLVASLGRDYEVARVATQLLRIRSPLLGQFVRGVCDNGYRAALRELAFALGPAYRNKDATSWLVGILSEVLDRSSVPDLMLGAALTRGPESETAWQGALSGEDAVAVEWLVPALALGSSQEAMAGLLGLANAAQSLANQSGQEEAELEWENAACDATAALSQWARQPKGTVPLRWKVLSKLLPSEVTNPDELWNCKVVLLGMAEMCKLRRFPEDQAYSPEQQSADWLGVFLKLSADAGSVPRLCAGRMGESTWGNERIARDVGTYRSPDEVGERMRTGQVNPVLDPDQKAVVPDALFEAFQRARALLQSGRAGEAEKQFRNIVGRFRRYPYCALAGSNRLVFRGKVQWNLAEALLRMGQTDNAMREAAVAMWLAWRARDRDISRGIADLMDRIEDATIGYRR